MTSEEMKVKFEKDGWSDVNFKELSTEEAREKGYLFALNTNKKFFAMSGSGNIYDENGNIAMFNISCRN